MEACGACGRTHRSKEAFGKCKEKAERLATRLAKKEADQKVREEVLSKEAPADYISRRRREGETFSKITAELSNLYPSPISSGLTPDQVVGEKDIWTLSTVVMLDSLTLVWPSIDQTWTWPDERITIRQLHEAVERGRE